MKPHPNEKSFIELDGKLVAVTYSAEAGLYTALYDKRTKRLNWFFELQFNLVDMYRRGCLYKIPNDIPIALPSHINPV